MTKINTKTIHEKIKSLDEQKAKLMESRRDEIADTVIKYGGLAIDNRLLAGFVAYAGDEKNKNSEFLKQMLEVSKELKMPSRRA